MFKETENGAAVAVPPFYSFSAMVRSSRGHLGCIAVIFFFFAVHGFLQRRTAQGKGPVSFAFRVPMPRSLQRASASCTSHCPRIHRAHSSCAPAAHPAARRRRFHKTGPAPTRRCHRCRRLPCGNGAALRPARRPAPYTSPYCNTPWHCPAPTHDGTAHGLVQIPLHTQALCIQFSEIVHSRVDPRVCRFFIPVNRLRIIRLQICPLAV